MFTFQEITTSIARRLLTVLYDVTMRSSLTFLIFGLGDTVNKHAFEALKLELERIVIQLCK